MTPGIVHNIVMPNIFGEFRVKKSWVKIKHFSHLYMFGYLVYNVIDLRGHFLCLPGRNNFLTVYLIRQDM